MLKNMMILAVLLMNLAAFKVEAREFGREILETADEFFESAEEFFDGRGLLDQFTVTDNFWSWTSDFTITSKGRSLGRIHRKMFSWSPREYELYDRHDNLQARGRMRWFSWFLTFDVTDQYDETLGRLQRQPSFILPVFHLVGKNEQTQAEVSLNFWGTTYTAVDLITGGVIATLKRPFFSFVDEWKVTVHDPILFLRNRIDYRFFALLAAFQTDCGRFDFSRILLNLGDSKDQASDGVTVSQKLREELENYRTYLTVEASDEDFVAVETHVAEKMQEEEKKNHEATLDGSELERGFAFILLMFEQSDLTQSQKSALFLMLEEHLRNLE